MSGRRASVTHRTGETTVAVELGLDGRGATSIASGIGMLDHLLSSLARYARFDLRLTCTGDLAVDDHHTAEDCALAFGAALDQALGERRGIERFGWALAPLDEALARVAVDLSGRPFSAVRLRLRRETLGTLAGENIPHVLASFATAARAALHVDVLRGANDHHKAEAAFKAAGLALRQAVRDSGYDDVPSLKGTLTR
jgi:imidazoleglycerol phosphate dehydratase HisB